MRCVGKLSGALLCALLLAATGPCEGATAVLLPLLNRTEAQEAGPVYWQQAVAKVEAMGFELASEDASQEAVITSMGERGSLPEAKELAQIAAASKADVVIAMELEQWKDSVKKGSKVRYKQLDLRGRSAVYHSKDEKLFVHGFGSNRQVEAAFTGRWDVKTEEWGRLVSKEIERALTAARP